MNLNDLNATFNRVAPLDLASIAPLPPSIKISSYLNVDGSPHGFNHSYGLLKLVRKKYYSIPIYQYPIGLRNITPIFICNFQYQPKKLGQTCYRAIKTKYGFIHESDSSYFVNAIWYLIQCLQKRRHQHYFLNVLREFMVTLPDYLKKKNTMVSENKLYNYEQEMVNRDPVATGADGGAAGGSDGVDVPVAAGAAGGGAAGGSDDDCVTEQQFPWIIDFTTMCMDGLYILLVRFNVVYRYNYFTRSIDGEYPRHNAIKVADCGTGFVFGCSGGVVGFQPYGNEPDLGPRRIFAGRDGRTLPGVQGQCITVIAVYDGYVLVGFNHNTLLLWRIEDGTLCTRIVTEFVVMSVQWVSNDTFAVCGLHNSYVCFWNTTGTCLGRIEGPRNMRDVRLYDDGDGMLFGVCGFSCDIWYCYNGTVGGAGAISGAGAVDGELSLISLTDYCLRIKKMAVCPNWYFFVLGCYDGSVHLCEIDGATVVSMHNIVNAPSDTHRRLISNIFVMDDGDVVIIYKDGRILFVKLPREATKVMMMEDGPGCKAGID